MCGAIESCPRCRGSHLPEFRDYTLAILLWRVYSGDFALIAILWRYYSEDSTLVIPLWGEHSGDSTLRRRKYLEPVQSHSIYDTITITSQSQISQPRAPVLNLLVTNVTSTRMLEIPRWILNLIDPTLAILLFGLYTGDDTLGIKLW